MTHKPHHLFLKYARQHRQEVVLLTGIYLTSTLLFVLAPQALSRFIDRVYEKLPYIAVLTAMALYIAALLSRTAMSSLLQIRLASLGQRITDAYRHDAMAHFLKLDKQQLSRWTSGEAMTRLDEDVQGLFQYYYVLLYKLAGSAIALVGILVALLRQNGWLSLALLLISVVSIWGFKQIQDRGIPKYVKRSQAAATFNSKMKEILDHATTLRALRNEEFATVQMQRAMTVRFQESLPANRMYGNLWSAATMMQALVVIFGIGMAAVLWDRQLITLGTTYLIYAYSEMIIEPLSDFRNHMGKMQGSKAGILRTQELFALPIAAEASLQLREGPVDICLEHVSFSYDNAEDTLQDISLTIPAGEHWGIMGETGCGKSTLMNILAGLLPYDRGSVRFQGLERKEIDPASLRQQIAYCSQRVQLLHSSLRNNITFYDSRFSDEDIRVAIETLQLTDWFAKFPQGLDTVLDLGEANLSAGEAQLITLIRLALRKPRVLLLDEITSNLDVETEARLTKSLQIFAQGKTVLAIAHRKEALAWMDQIIGMEKGRHVAMGHSQEVAMEKVGDRV